MMNKPVDIQKDLLEIYEEASRAWLARTKSELDLWSGLGAKLATTRSVPETIDAYQKCLTRRMQMAAQDGQQSFERCKKIAQKLTGALSNAWPAGTS
jgi:hypothetical protein